MTMEFVRKRRVLLGTILFDLFLLWTVVRFVVGGWERAVHMMVQGPTVWGCILLALICLALIRSDFRTDLPLYLSAFSLAYWLEWWGTTRGLWTYSGNQTPPIGEIFLWGICLLSVYHAHLILRGTGKKKRGTVAEWIMMTLLFILPLAGLVLTWNFILRVDWMRHLDFHSVAAVALAAFLIVKDFDLRETFWIFAVGTFLGGLLETLGTASGRYAYLSGQGAPLMVGPAWGVICVVMVKFGYQIRKGSHRAISLLTSGLSSPKAAQEPEEA